MNIYFDENISPYIVRAFQELQKPIDVRNDSNTNLFYLPDLFGRGAPDEEWIPGISKSPSCVITQDLNIKRLKHQRKLFQQHEIGMFFIKSPNKKKGIHYWKKVQLLTHHWEEINKIILEEKRPFSYRLGTQGGAQRWDD